MEEFSKRLKDLRLSHGKTQQELADYLGIRQQSYFKYEKGTGQPSIEAIILLVRYFDVSSDYLLGKSEIYTEKPNNFC